ncbi:class I SAM-dependent methyltransferase [Streptomyces sp. NPDC057521]|uniref:class I SAM-dependent methyltransferase n=1 Tax=Streptomyces sp. NPDC057521 TaxID=3346156 RepID=UPI0036B959CC
MTPQDAIDGWDEERNAEAYARFAQQYPMYSATSRELVGLAGLDGSSLAVDLCGGTGIAAEAMLDDLPGDARVISVDSSRAMQDVGQRNIQDPRLTWVTARAEAVADHIHEPADAVVCNSAIWKTDIPVTFAAVRSILRPGGHFVFNVGGGFAGVAHPDEATGRKGPSLNTLIQGVAARDYGYVLNKVPPKSPNPFSQAALEEQLRASGFSVTEARIVAHRSTMAEKKAWLSIPLFARPDGDYTYEQRMEMLDRAYMNVDPDQTTVTSWLVVVAQATSSTR